MVCSVKEQKGLVPLVTLQGFIYFQIDLLFILLDSRVSMGEITNTNQLIIAKQTLFVINTSSLFLFNIFISLIVVNTCFVVK